MTDQTARTLADKIRADIARESAEITAIVLRETADRFEQECPDADGALDLCMCHAAPVLRGWADEAQFGDDSEMAASLRRDGFGDDEIAEMLARPAAEAPFTAEELAAARADVDALDAEFPDEPETGTRQCGHDDYHDVHEWADRPGIWCPGHSLTDTEGVAARPVVSPTT